MHFYPGSGQYRALIGEHDDVGHDQLGPEDNIATESLANVDSRNSSRPTHGPPGCRQSSRRLPFVTTRGAAPGRYVTAPGRLAA